MTTLLTLENATSTMRSWIDQRALEELFGERNAGRVRRPIEWSKSKPRGVGRFSRPVDFKSPAPVSQRPTSADGRSTIHVDIKVVGKGGAGSVKGTSPAALHATYLVTEKKVAGRSPGQDVKYLTRPKSECPADDQGTRAAILVSNISEDAKELERYWEARSQSARNTGRHRLELVPERGTAEAWEELAAATDTPPHVATTARRIHLLLSASRKVRRRSMALLDAGTIEWASNLGNRFGPHKGDRIIHYPTPRSAKVQIQIVFEFDDRLDKADRGAILRTIMAKLDAAGIRMLAVAHDPDANNDPRNYHPHILVDPTIFPRNPGGALLWTGGRKMRPGELAIALGYTFDNSAPATHWQLGKLDYRSVREEVVRLTNDRLAERSIGGKFDAGSFEKLGIRKVPERHMGSEAAWLVAVGATVDLHRENAIKSWRYEYELRSAAIDNEERGFALSRCALEREIADVDAHLKSDACELLEQHRLAAQTMIARARELMEFDLRHEIARSAAEQVKKRTSRVLASLQDGNKATAIDRRDRQNIETRHLFATRHLEELEEAIEPYRLVVEASRDAQARARGELEIIEARIHRAVVPLRDHRAQRDWQRGTVLSPHRHPSPLAPQAHAEALIEHLLQQGVESYGVPPDRAIAVFREHASSDPTCAGLGSADLYVLRQGGQIRQRWSSALRTAEKRQSDAIARLLGIVEAHGRNALKLGRYRTGGELPASLRHWRDLLHNHPRFLADVARANDVFSRSLRNDRSDVDRTGTTAGAHQTPDAETKQTSSASHAAAEVARQRTRGADLLGYTMRPANMPERSDRSMGAKHIVVPLEAALPAASNVPLVEQVSQDMAELAIQHSGEQPIAQTRHISELASPPSSSVLLSRSEPRARQKAAAKRTDQPVETASKETIDTGVTAMAGSSERLQGSRDQSPTRNSSPASDELARNAPTVVPLSANASTAQEGPGVLASGAKSKVPSTVFGTSDVARIVSPEIEALPLVQANAASDANGGQEDGFKATSSLQSDQPNSLNEEQGRTLPPARSDARNLRGVKSIPTGKITGAVKLTAKSDAFSPKSTDSPAVSSARQAAIALQDQQRGRSPASRGRSVDAAPLVPRSASREAVHPDVSSTRRARGRPSIDQATPRATRINLALARFRRGRLYSRLTDTVGFDAQADMLVSHILAEAVAITATGDQLLLGGLTDTLRSDYLALAQSTTGWALLATIAVAANDTELPKKGAAWYELKRPEEVGSGWMQQVARSLAQER